MQIHSASFLQPFEVSADDIEALRQRQQDLSLDAETLKQRKLPQRNAQCGHSCNVTALLPAQACLWNIPKKRRYRPS